MTQAGVVVGVARTEFRRHRRSLVAAALLVGLLGGVSIGALAGARRTSTAYDRLLVASDFPDAFVQIAGPAPGVIDEVLESPAIGRAVVSIFAVGRFGGEEGQNLFPVQAAAEPLAFHQIVEGREPDPSSPDEVLLSETMSGIFGLDVGDTIPHEALTETEFADLLNDEWDGSASGVASTLRVVGITRTPLDAVIDDFPTLVGTRAYVQRFDLTDTVAQVLWVDLAEGATIDELVADVDAATAVGGSTGGSVVDFAAERTQLDDTVGVLTMGLVGAGLVAFIALVVVVLQISVRQAEQTDAERQVLRELGVSRRDRLLSALAATVLPGAIAAVTSVVVAGFSSRWTPIGVADRLEPHPGVAWNLTILSAGAGTVLVIALLGSLYATTRAERAGTPRAYRARAPRRWVGALSRGPVGSVGVALALAGGRRSSTQRVAVVGLVTGVGGLIALAMVAASLQGLVTEPRGWGQIADDDVNLPSPVRDQTLAVLDVADEVEAYVEVAGGPVIVDGRVVDGYWLTSHKGEMAPTVLEGRVPTNRDEIALGPALLDDLGVDVGDPVSVEGSSRLVVGSVLTFGRADRSSFTEGALLGGPAGDRAEYTSAMVRYAAGVDAEAAAARLYGDLEYGAPSRPVSLTNLSRLRPLGGLLAAIVGLVILAAIVLVGVGAATRNRHDLAVLRSLGMARKATIRAVIVATAIVVGLATVPAGILAAVVGRSIWRALVSTTGLPVSLRVPTAVAAIPAGIAVIVLLVGIAAGTWAARRPPAGVLRAE